MSWTRQKSDLETLMVAVLKKRKRALSLGELVSEIKRLDSSELTGRTPTKSLYSVIYRREKRRLERGEEPLFMATKDRNTSIYSLNPKHPESP